jgi:hypothetical protein
MGDVIYVDFKKKKDDGVLTDEELETLFLNLMRDSDSPPFDRPDGYDEEE